MEIVIASLALSAIGILVKTTTGQVSPAFALCIRSLFHVLVLTPFILKAGFRVQLKREALLRGICGFAGMILYFVSLQKLPLTLATSIFWSAPVFTLIFSHAAERKRFAPHESFSIGLILIGIFLLSGQNDAHTMGFELSSFAIALLSSVGIGGSYYYLGTLTRAKEAPLSITYSFSLLMFLFSAPFALSSTPKSLSAPMIGALMGIAVLAIFYQFLITRAYAKTTPDRAATMQVTLIPMISILADRLLFAHSLTWLSTTALTFLLAGNFIKRYPISLPRLRAAHALIILVFLSTLPKALAITEKELQGTWSLVSFSKVEDGRESTWCEKPFGTLSYFAGNRMSVSINCMNPAAPDQVTGNPADMVFYSGTYSIDTGDAVIHHVQNSSDPTRIGHDHIRYAKAQGNRIELTGMGSKGPLRIIWEKL